MGAFALVPRNIGATLFFPSLVMVTFCWMTCGSVTKCKSQSIFIVPATDAGGFGMEDGTDGFDVIGHSCTGVRALPITAAIILAGASASFSFDFFSNSSWAGLSGSKIPCLSCPYLAKNWTFSSNGRGFPKSPSSKIHTVIEPSYEEMNKLVPSGDQQRSEMLFSAMSCVMTSGRGFRVFHILRTRSWPAQAIIEIHC